MSWVSSSSYTQNKDRFFFHVTAQLLYVLVKSYWSQRKWPGLGLLLVKGSFFPTLYKAHISFWLLDGNQWNLRRSIPNRSVYLHLTNQPGRENSYLESSRSICENTPSSAVKSPWELFPFKIFPKKNPTSHKGKARLRQEHEAKSTLCSEQPRQWEKAVCLFLFSLYNCNCHVNSLIKRSELVTKVLVRNARHCRNQHFNLSFEQNEALT